MKFAPKCRMTTWGNKRCSLPANLIEHAGQKWLLCETHEKGFMELVFSQAPKSAFSPYKAALIVPPTKPLQ